MERGIAVMGLGALLGILIATKLRNRDGCGLYMFGRIIRAHEKAHSNCSNYFALNWHYQVFLVNESFR